MTEEEKNLAFDRAEAQVEAFDIPGATEAEWGAEACRRFNVHLAQECGIICLGLDRLLTPEALDNWRVTTLPKFIAVMTKR